jgi:hypothetical protein
VAAAARGCAELFRQMRMEWLGSTGQPQGVAAPSALRKKPRAAPSAQPRVG